MTDRPRVLVVAHGHPEREPGGGEIAARAQHRTLLASGEFDSVFLARHDDPFPPHEGAVFAGNGRPSEALFHTALGDRFLFAPADPARIWRHFREALEIIRPDIVHFHHFLHIGLPALGEVRRFAPRVPIALTLHDFQAICHNDGQMVHPRSGALCRRASPEACRGCFPSRGVQDFALRERYVKACLEHVDRFVAPSRFLARRYTDWGIEASRITVLENLLDPDIERAAARADASGTSVADAVGEPAERRLRLAYFGRINGVKGVDLLLEAMRLLPPDVRARVRLDVHGAGLERQPLVRRAALRRALRALRDCVRLRGAYHPDEMATLMRETDWMVMPSRWWENSPVVILEAKRHGVPVICADIGGMAEKVEHGTTGLHFRANDAHALAERLCEALALGADRERLAANARRAFDPADTAARHVALHRELLELASGRESAAPSSPSAPGRAP